MYLLKTLDVDMCIRYCLIALYRDFQMNPVKVKIQPLFLIVTRWHIEIIPTYIRLDEYYISL